jgi:ribosomal protein L15
LIIKTINIDKIMMKFPINSIITINKLRKYKIIKGKASVKVKFINGHKKMHPLSLDTNYISKSLKLHLEEIGGKVIFVK